MGLEDEQEPTAAWVARAMGLGLDEAEWLLVLYRFMPAEGEARPDRVYVCEAIP
jgi:hypothetical protein